MKRTLSRLSALALAWSAISIIADNPGLAQNQVPTAIITGPPSPTLVGPPSPIITGPSSPLITGPSSPFVVGPPAAPGAASTNSAPTQTNQSATRATSSSPSAM